MKKQTNYSLPSYPKKCYWRVMIQQDMHVTRQFVVTKVHSKQKLYPVDIDIKLGHVFLNPPQKCYKNCRYGEKLG